MLDLSIRLNGHDQNIQVEPNDVLADVLRNQFGLLGCKVGCDQGVCGACTILVDGEPVASCTTFAFRIDGKSLTTIEGLEREGELHPVQEAFLAQGAFQCGFCTSGMILSVIALLQQDPDPDENRIRSWLGGNICRCTGYGAIVSAVKQAQTQMREVVG